MRLALATAAAGLIAFAAVTAWSQTAGLSFEIDGDRDGDGLVNLELSYRPTPTSHHSIGRTTELKDLAGLSDAQLAGTTTTPVRFRVTRDAGTFACEGSARADHASGTCDFAENPGFARTLEQRGVGRPIPGQLLKLAMSDVGVAYLDELMRQRYADVTVGDLARAADHGVSLKYLRGMDEAGYRVGRLENLTSMRDHGVTPRYVAELRAAGYGSIPADQIVRLRDHGVSTTWLAGLRDAGYSNMPMEELVRLRDHGVTASWLAGLREAGYARLPLEQLVRLRDHGVSASYLQGLQQVGYSGLHAEQMIRLRDHGVTADFARRVIASAGRVDPEELVRMRDRGWTGRERD